MPPAVALLMWFILLLLLFRNDPAKDKRVSPAVWLSFVWMSILGSRSASLWLSLRATSTTTALEEGNPLDHVVYLTLIVLAVRILAARHFQWRNIATLNTSLTLLLLFSLLSVLWSDFPFASLRRLIRESGNYFAVLVVLSEAHPQQAIEALLRRVSYFLISLSVVLIKYFREVGVMHSIWTGEQEFIGITTSKNMLGVVCLVSGLFFFWDVLQRWPNRRAAKEKKVLVVNIIFIGMTLWLLNLSHSATSQLCLVIGCLIVTLVLRGPATLRRNLKHTLPIALCVGVALEFAFNLSDTVAQLMGRDPSLTGRTEIWAALLNARTNPIIGVGFASFWLGDRLLSLWETLKLVGLNEAHNGYLETYLELGLVGVCLLGGFLVASYRTICKRLATSVEFASLSFALWTMLLVYNLTEASFKNSVLWLTFLLVGIAVPASSAETRPNRREATEPTSFRRSRVGARGRTAAQ